MELTCWSVCNSEASYDSSSKSFSNLLDTDTYTGFLNPPETLEFSIRGFTNPSTTAPFEFILTTFRTIDSVDYYIDKFTFNTMAVVTNTNMITVDNESKEGGTDTTLTVTYLITQTLPSDIYFELTMPPNNLDY